MLALINSLDSSEKTMIKKYRRLLRCLLLLSIILIALAGCNKDEYPTAVREVQTHNLPVVATKLQNIALYYRTTGSVVSDSRVDITSRVTGFIEQIIVKDGQRVTKGQELVLLDSNHVDGAIQQAVSLVSKARLSLQDAQTDTNRYEELFKSGTIAANTLQKTRLLRDVARDSLHEAEAGLAAAQSERQYTRIVSPANGVVVSRSKRNGDLATPGVPIIAIESDTTLLFDTYIPESRVSQIAPGLGVTMEIDALGKSLDGVVSSIIPSGDPVTRRYQVKISLPEANDALPGMFGRVRFVVGLEQSPVIPSTALIERGGLKGVFVVNDEGRAYFRWLRLGQELPNTIQVTAGLDAGEQIVAIAETQLREGDRIVAMDSVR